MDNILICTFCVNGSASIARVSVLAVLTVLRNKFVLKLFNKEHGYSMEN